MKSMYFVAGMLIISLQISVYAQDPKIDEGLKDVDSLSLKGQTLNDLFPKAANDTFVSIFEEYRDGKSRRLYDRKPAIVDMGSVLKIRLNKGMIEREMLIKQGISTSDGRLKKIHKINSLLRNEIQILSLVNQVLVSNNGASNRVYNELAGLTARLTSEIIKDQELSKEINKALAFEYPKKVIEKGGNYPAVLFVVEQLDEMSSKLKKEMLAELNKKNNIDSANQVFFRLGAFIRNREGGRPVHVENFDTYQKEDFNPVLRFNAPISDEEREAISENGFLTGQLDQSLTTTVEEIKRIFNAEIGEIFTSFDKYETFRESYRMTMAALSDSAEAAPVFNLLKSNFDAVEGIGRLFSFVSSTFNSFSLNLINESVSTTEQLSATARLEQSLREAYGGFESQVQLLMDNEAGSGAGLDSLAKVKQTYSEFKEAVGQDLLTVKKIFTDIQNLLNPFKKAYLNNELFSDEVNRFTVDDLPAEGYVELKYIVAKRPGDEILVKAELEEGEGGRTHELYRRYIKLERIETNVKMAGSIILANPFQRDETDQVTIKSKYQFTPTYGIFLKWGSRKSHFYNNFLNFGLGLSFSSPDFNTDGTPEFGAGIILTGLKDLLNIGWGYNFGIDTPYSFIGFNIPFSVGGLPNIATTADASR